MRWLPEGTSRDSVRWYLDLATTVALIGAATAVIWKTGGTSQPSPPRLKAPSEAINVSRRTFQGRQSAPVALVVVSDFQCPVCRQFAVRELPTIQTTLVDTGRVALFYWHLPLPDLHPLAQAAGEAFECAADEGRAWELFQPLADSLAPEQRPTQSAILTVAKELGLGPDFERCLLGRQHREAVDRDAAAARAMGLAGTPSFMIGRLSHGSLAVNELLQGYQASAAIAAAVGRVKP